MVLASTALALALSFTGQQPLSLQILPPWLPPPPDDLGPFITVMMDRDRTTRLFIGPRNSLLLEPSPSLEVLYFIPPDGLPSVPDVRRLNMDPTIAEIVPLLSQPWEIPSRDPGVLARGGSPQLAFRFRFPFLE